MRWSERLGGWEAEHRLAIDAAGAIGLGLLVLAVSATLGTSAVWWTLALLAPLPWRRVAPAPSAAAVFTVALAQVLVGATSGGFPLLPADLAVLAALYSVTAYGPRWAHLTAIGGAVAGAGVLGAVVAVQQGNLDPTGPLVASLLVLLSSAAVYAFGLFRRARREQVDALVERARRLEAERDQQAVLAAAAERSRIAREMHDIVAHSLSVVVAQADGGRYAGQADPAAAVRALTTIAETGRAALADMRRLLGVLRTEDDSPELRPQPAADQVADLVEQVRGSGLDVSLVRLGTPRTLPPGVGLAVYRIAQESLTNVLKHAGPAARATVLVQWTAASLVLEVSDDGRGAAAVDDGAGHGVAGIRERVAMLGGTVSLGPRIGGGFRVRAEVPLPRAAAVETAPTTGVLPTSPAPEDR